MDLTSEFARLVETYGYLAIVAGSFLDGETSVILAGAAAGHGMLTLPLVVLVAAAINWAWDQGYYWLGRRHGPAIVRRYPVVAPGLRVAARALERHQALFIIAMRFMVGFRIAGPVALGVLGVRPIRFAVLNGVGALLWALLVAGAGYVGAIGIDWLATSYANAMIDLPVLAVIGVFLVIIATAGMRASRFRMTKRLDARPSSLGNPGRCIADSSNPGFHDLAPGVASAVAIVR